jgi:hypothetical protein
MEALLDFGVVVGGLMLGFWLVVGCLHFTVTSDFSGWCRNGSLVENLA